MILSSAAVGSSCRYFAALSLPGKISHHVKLKSELCTKGVKLDGKAGHSSNDILCPVLTLLRTHKAHVNFQKPPSFRGARSQGNCHGSAQR